MQDGAQRVVDLVRHAGGQTADREHLLRLHHHLFQIEALGDVVDADHHTTAAAARQRVKSQGKVMRQLIATPGDPLDFFHLMLLDSAP